MKILKIGALGIYSLDPQECNGGTFAVVKTQLEKVRENQQKLLRVVATGEIFIMPLVILQLFTG